VGKYSNYGNQADLEIAALSEQASSLIQELQAQKDANEKLVKEVFALSEQIKKLTQEETIVWSDEFEGTAINTSNWKALYSTYGSGGGQIQCHTPANVTVNNGTAKLVARKEQIKAPDGTFREYSGAFLSSRDAGKYHPLYGKYEMRARIPHGQGIATAFWLRHRNGSSTAEVDVMEIFHAQTPGNITHTLHFQKSLGLNVSKKSVPLEVPVVGTGGWHTFAVDIRPVVEGDDSQVVFKFFVDGKETMKYTNTNASSWTSVDKSAAWDIAVSQPVGGSYWGHPEKDLGYLSSGLIGGTNPNKCSLTYKTPTSGPASCPTDKNGDGKPDIWFASFPSLFEVDYVRVYA
jgi:beta-glucanase (GH16 family)